MGEGKLVDMYCLMGEEVSGSLSPSMMNAAFEAAGIDALYESISVEREEFRRRFLALQGGDEWDQPDDAIQVGRTAAPRRA